MPIIGTLREDKETVIPVRKKPVIEKIVQGVSSALPFVNPTSPTSFISAIPSAMESRGRRYKEEGAPRVDVPETRPRSALARLPDLGDILLSGGNPASVAGVVMREAVQGAPGQSYDAARAKFLNQTAGSFPTRRQAQRLPDVAAGAVGLASDLPDLFIPNKYEAVASLATGVAPLASKGVRGAWEATKNIVNMAAPVDIIPSRATPTPFTPPPEFILPRVKPEVAARIGAPLSAEALQEGLQNVRFTIDSLPADSPTNRLLLRTAHGKPPEQAERIKQAFTTSRTINDLPLDLQTPLPVDMKTESGVTLKRFGPDEDVQKVVKDTADKDVEMFKQSEPLSLEKAHEIAQNMGVSTDDIIQAVSEGKADPVDLLALNGQIVKTSTDFLTLRARYLEAVKRNNKAEASSLQQLMGQTLDELTPVLRAESKMVSTFGRGLRFAQEISRIEDAPKVAAEGVRELLTPTLQKSLEETIPTKELRAEIIQAVKQASAAVPDAAVRDISRIVGQSIDDTTIAKAITEYVTSNKYKQLLEQSVKKIMQEADKARAAAKGKTAASAGEFPLIMRKGKKVSKIDVKSMISKDVARGITRELKGALRKIIQDAADVPTTLTRGGQKISARLRNKNIDVDKLADTLAKKYLEKDVPKAVDRALADTRLSDDISVKIKTSLQERDAKLAARNIRAMSQPRVAENVKNISKYVGQIDPMDTEAVNRFIMEYGRSNFADKMYYYFINNILGSVLTFGRNAAGMATNVALKPPMTLLSSVYDMALSALRGTERTVYAGESVQMLFAAFGGIPEGLRKGLHAGRTGLPVSRMTRIDIEELVKRRPIRGVAGNIIGFPSRALLAADEMAKAIIHRMEIHAQAYTMVKSEKLSGAEAKERLIELIQNPTNEMVDKAAEDAVSLAYQERASWISKFIALRSDTPGLRYIVPFIATPINITKMGLEYSPLSFTPLHMMYGRHKPLKMLEAAAKDHWDSQRTAFRTGMESQRARVTQEIETKYARAMERKRAQGERILNNLNSRTKRQLETKLQRFEDRIASQDAQRLESMRRVVSDTADETGTTAPGVREFSSELTGPRTEAALSQQRKARVERLAKALEDKARNTLDKTQQTIRSRIDEAVSKLDAQKAKELAKTENEFSRIMHNRLKQIEDGLKQDVAKLQKGNQKALAERFARATVGSAVAFQTAIMVQEGNMTGSFPDSPAERDALYASGAKPYSVKIGDKWVTYLDKGHLGVTMGITVDLINHYKRNNETPGPEFIANLLAITGRTVLNMTSLTQLGDLYNAINDPSRYGQRFTGRLLSGFVTPGWARDIARLNDNVVRNPEGVYEMILAQSPIGVTSRGVELFPSRSLAPRIDVFGNTALRQGVFSQGPTAYQRTEPLYREDSQRGERTGFAGKSISGVELNNHEYAQLQSEAGKTIASVRTALQGTPRYTALPMVLKNKILSDLEYRARKNARIRLAGTLALTRPENEDKRKLWEYANKDMKDISATQLLDAHIKRFRRGQK